MVLNLSRRVYITSAFLLAILTTLAGWWQTMRYKIPPPIPLALWFPFVVIPDAHDVAAVVLSFIQFPLFAIIFTFGIRRWRPTRVLLVLVLAYGLLALGAFVIARSK